MRGKKLVGVGLVDGAVFHPAVQVVADVDGALAGVADKVGRAVDGIDDEIAALIGNLEDIALLAVEAGLGESGQKLTVQKILDHGVVFCHQITVGGLFLHAVGNMVGAENDPSRLTDDLVDPFIHGKHLCL